MKKLKISWDEVIKLLEEHYKIKNIQFMKHSSYEGDYEICEFPVYIEGDIEL